MPITLRWLDEDRTMLYQRLEGKFSAEEFLASVDEIAARTGSAGHRVYVISEADASVPPPPGLLRLMTTAVQKVLAVPNAKMLIAVGGNLFLNTIGNVVIRYKRLHDRMVLYQTLDEALQRVKDEKAREVESSKIQ